MQGVLTFVVYMTVLQASGEVMVECIPVVRPEARLTETRVYQEDKHGVLIPQLPESAFAPLLTYCAKQLSLPYSYDSCTIKRDLAPPRLVDGGTAECP